MKRSTIMQRLTLLTAIPVTALVLYSGMLIWESFGRYQDVILAEKVIEAAVAAGDLIQPMQIERGMTAGFVQSKGQKFADALPGIRAKTDEKLASYTRIIEEMAVTEPLITAVKEARQRLDELAKTRNQASQYSISAAESSAYFTATIDKLLDVQSAAVEYNKDPAIGKRLLAYHSFSNGKEYAGQERALSMPVFAANKVEPAQYRTILNRIYKQEAYLDSFLDFANEQEKTALKSVLDGDAATDVGHMRAAMARISEHPDVSAGETTSHLVKPAKSADQANGYGHSTGLSAEKLLAGQPKDNNHVAGYSPAKNAGQVVGNEHVGNELGTPDVLTGASNNSSFVIPAKAGTMSNQAAGCGPLPARRVNRVSLVAPGKKLAAAVADLPAQGTPVVDPAVWFKRSTDRINGLYEVEQLVVKNITSDTNILLASSRTFLLTQLILAVLAIALAVAVSVWVARSVNRPLQAVVDAAEYAVANDDFTHGAPEDGTQETARVGQAINLLMEKFRSIISDATRSSEGIADASSAMAASSSEVNKSSSVQANAASTVAAAVEEVSVSVSETAANARNAGEIVEKSRIGTENALAVMTETVQNVNSIAALIRESDAKVGQLDGSSKKIGGIIQVIREVADQTNLLALNAAIEAARAGEQGRGFAVVADEVRKLAERTAKATAEIAALIGDIQNHISETVTGMQQANTQVGESLELVGKTENALHRIGDDSREVASKVQSIVDAIHEQDAAIQQVAANIEKIAQMSEENTAAAASNSDTAAQLDRLSGALKESVIRFKV